MFSVAVRWRTYLRLLYLLIGLPLGLFYAVFFTVAFVLGLGLLVIGIGAIILAATGMLAWNFVEIERQTAVLLLGVDLPPLRSPKTREVWSIEALRDYVTDGGTWRALGILFAKLPLGIVAFAVALGLIFVASVMAAAPLIALIATIDLGIWRIDHEWQALIAFVISLPLGLLALHIIDRLGLWYGTLARLEMASLFRSTDGTRVRPDAALIPTSDA